MNIITSYCKTQNHDCLYNPSSCEQNFIMHKFIFLVCCLSSLNFSVLAQNDAYLFYNTENTETCSMENIDGTTTVVDTFFKMENKSGITFFICGERFFYRKTTIKPESQPIHNIDKLKLTHIEDAVKLWKESKKSKQEVFDKIYIVQKNSPDTVVFYPVNWQ